MNSQSRNFGPKIGKIGENQAFFVGDQNLKVFEILLFLHICISNIIVLLNFIENEAKLVMLRQIQYLRVLSRKFGFSDNKRSQKAHKY